MSWGTHLAHLCNPISALNDAPTPQREEMHDPTRPPGGDCPPTGTVVRARRGNPRSPRKTRDDVERAAPDASGRRCSYHEGAGAARRGVNDAVVEGSLALAVRDEDREAIAELVADALIAALERQGEAEAG